MKLSNKKLTALCAEAFEAAAGGSHDHIMEIIHDTAADEVDRILKAAGIDFDKLADEQQDELTGAYKDGFWNPNNKPDLARIVIHVEGGLVQGVTANMDCLYLVADTDTEGALETMKVPKELAALIASKRMNQAFRHEAATNLPAVDAAFEMLK
jgi:hypothetical protein